MKINKFKIKNLAFIATLALVSACSSKLDTYATNTEASPQLESAEAKLLSAEKNQVNVFAPSSYEKAMDALKEAKAERKDNANNVEILKAIELTDTLTIEAYRKSDIAQTALPGVAEARLAALAVKANENSEKDFKKAESELIDYTSDVEDGKIKNSKKVTQSLLSKYQALLVKGTLSVKLGQTVSFINQAKNEGASDNAPKTLARAMMYYEKAVAVIRSNPNNYVAIDPVAGEAQFEAEKLLRVTRKTKAAGGAKSEDVVLQAESQQQYIFSQSEEIARVQNEKQNMQSQVKGLKGIKNLQDKVAAVSRKFNSNEADVYQQGNAVILRLKGIQFPNNKVEIPSTSYATLKKVQESIESFNSPKVRIEGHTDAVGSREKNLPLSQKRAEAVKKYMTANLDLKNVDLETEGFGSSKPISSNKTPEGRAQNRRIDIVIEEI
jgi:OmpA-OmpF porin, OOP family